MLLPALATGVAPTTGTFSTETGIAPSFCTPCVLGKRICGLPFSPNVEDCDGGNGGGCVPGNIGPCIPFINKQLRCCIPGGCSLVDC
jgi:hypothetical protein